MEKNFGLSARFRVGKTPTSIYSDPMGSVNFALDNNIVDCIVGSLANPKAAESLSRAKLFVDLVNINFLGKKFNQLLELGQILSSEPVRGIPEWKNWRLERFLSRELFACPPA